MFREVTRAEISPIYARDKSSLNQPLVSPLQRDMLKLAFGSIAIVLPFIVLFAILNHHNPAYIPVGLLVALIAKRSIAPPLLRPLSRLEAVTRLKFNLFLLLHLAISVGFFPPYLSLRRGVVWYLDEYVQGRRGGQKSWALASVQAIGECSRV